ncbi:MAG: AraC family transcriptional regulator ligand-binding domain-containing protein, partial [Myxococcota bacterium]
MSSPTAPAIRTERASGFVNVPRGLFVALAEGGADLEADVRAAGIDPRVLKEREAVIERHAYERFLDVVLDPLRGASVGVRVGARLRLELFGTLGLVMLSAPTYQAALARCARYKALLSDLRVDVERGVTNATIEVSTFGGRTDDPHAPARIEAEIGLFVQVGRRLVAPAVRFICVHLRRPAPSHQAKAEFAEVLRCPIRFASERDALVLASVDLDRPLLSADPEAYPLLAACAERRLDADERELVGRVRRAAESLLPEGAPALTDVASHLHVAPRTLQRRL